MSASAGREVRAMREEGACLGVPDELLEPGILVKLACYLAHLQTEVEFLRQVRDLQAKMLREKAREGVAP